MKTLPVLTINLYVTIAFGMQLYADDRVQFEAASVKQASQCTYESSILGPGSVAIKGVPLKPILMTAFKVGKDQIIGPHGWRVTVSKYSPSCRKVRQAIRSR